MSSQHLTLSLIVAGLGALACGCVCPRPQSFADAPALPSGFVGERYRAHTEGQKLVIEVSQIPGFNAVALDQYVQDGALYLTPFHISSGGAGMRRFEIDVSKHRLAENWRTHVYWLIEGPTWYPIFHAGFWSSAHRDSWVRKRVEIAAE